MFERFTRRARRVVVLAQEEARMLDHNYIGTEHLLLGLLHEGENAPARVLTAAGITLDATRTEVEERIGRGKSTPSGHIPFTPRAKKTLELSLREALTLRHNYIGAEHILLGLIREGEGVAFQIMGGHTDLIELRAAVIEATGGSREAEPDEEEAADETNAVLRWLKNRLNRHGTTSAPFRPGAPGEFTARGTPAAEATLREAATLAGSLPVGSHHLLLAALADSNSAASATLASLGVDLYELKKRLSAAELAGTSDEQPEEAGRRQMALKVSDEILTIVLTDPVIVADAKRALRTAKGNAEPSARGGDEPAPDADANTATDAADVIRGDHPAAANLANVWLELRKTLDTLADADYGALDRKQTKVARRLHYGSPRGEQPPAAPAADEPESGAGDESGTSEA